MGASTVDQRSLEDFFFSFAVLGFELRACNLSHSWWSGEPFLVKDVFEIGSCKLFAWAGFELQSS
jgi:hypothetical protein